MMCERRSDALEEATHRPEIRSILGTLNPPQLTAATLTSNPAITPQQLWQSRAEIDYTERARFRLAVEQSQEEQREKRSCGPEEQPTAVEHRRAVRQALVELGILATVWRSITLPIQPRKVAKILWGAHLPEKMIFAGDGFKFLSNRRLS
jgi:hypothetical protein